MKQNFSLKFNASKNAQLLYWITWKINEEENIVNVGGHKNNIMYLEYWSLQGLPADGAVEDIQLQGDAGGVVAVHGHWPAPSPTS